MVIDPVELSKAQELIQNGKVVRLTTSSINLIDHFQVTGSNNEKYLTILPDFCTCMHFHISCIKEQGSICKHILACRIASTNIPVVDLDDWQSLIFDDYHAQDD